MPERSQEEITEAINTTSAGCVVAAAGCGKTEQIGLAAKALSESVQSSKRCLVLTHTFAGVDVLKKRFGKLAVPKGSYQLDTIASWCLRYAAAHPKTSGIGATNPKSNQDWESLYPAAVKLLRSGCVDQVIKATYQRVLVDEYQDCVVDQHDLIVELKKLLPVCIFGDPLQSIFGFAGAIDWHTAVVSEFPVIVKMSTPWRWRKDGANASLGEKLIELRRRLENSESLDFSADGCGISRRWLPDQDGPRSGAISAVCLDTMNLDGTLVVVAQSGSDNARATIAKRLAKQRFSVVEPVSSQSLAKHAKTIANATDDTRIEVVLKFLKACVVGVRADFANAVTSHRQGKQAGRTKYGNLIDVGDRVGKPDGRDYVVELVEGFLRRDDVYPYRRELLSTMLSAMRTAKSESVPLTEATADIQLKFRHLGRNLPRRCVGSTLLLKGLEFEHVIIVEHDGMTREDWYVALTRATKSVIVLSRSPQIVTAT